MSIGKNCDRVGIVEHEFLHALGLLHEQARADRDDYVDIMWDQIVSGDVAPKELSSSSPLYPFRAHEEGEGSSTPG